MNKTKKIIKSDGSLKQKIKELIKQVIDEITTSSAAGSGEGSAGVPRVPTWVSKNKKGRPDVATVLGYTLAKPVNEAADPNAQQDPNAQPPQQGGEQGQQDPNLYDAKLDLSDFESRVSQSTLQNKSSFQNKIMSKIGKDFEKGGFYFRDKNNKKMNIEHKLEIGDSVMFYGSIVHGVDAVDPNKKLNWKSYDGRWFVGMFVNDSNHVKNRITANDLTNSTNFKKTGS
jgi:hypothetical protein